MGVFSFLGVPFMEMLAPGGFEVMNSLPSGAGAWDAESWGNRNTQHRRILDALAIASTLMLTFRSEIVVGKICKEHYSQKERVEMSLLGKMRVEPADITIPVLQYRDNK